MAEPGSGAFVRHVWLTVLILACTAILAWSASRAHAAENVTTVYIVRHAEKAPGGGDAHLADPAGFDRAKAQSHVLGASGLTDLADDRYDRLFVVHLFGEDARLQRLRYGASTP